MNGRALALALAVGIVFWALALAAVMALAGGPDTIREDDPRWDCATMGNQRCGESVGA